MDITTEVHFAQQLACNQQKISDKTLKKVGKWLAVQSVNKDALTEDSLMKLWKGIFYYFWSADKPLLQEEKADVICSYIHVFKTVDYSFMYIDTFFKTMAREWLTIDRYRVEKFMMLVRKFLHQTYRLLKNLKWELKWIKRFRKVLKNTVLDSSPESATPLGLRIHISDIYMEELTKVGYEELTPENLLKFLVPYCKILVENDESAFLSSISQDVFLYLINQNVDEKLFHEFPVLNFDADAVQKLLMKYANKPGVRKQNMRGIYNIIKEFEDYKSGVCSIDRILSDKSTVRKLKKRDIEKAALDLVNDEIAYTEENLKSKKKKKITEDVIDV